MFDAAHDEKKKAKVDEKKRKEAKKRRREEEEKKNSLLNNIMNLMPGQGDEAATSKVAALAPKARTSPEPVLEKRPRKPGAKTVRWTDQASARPLEMVREIEIDPLERGKMIHNYCLIYRIILLSISLSNIFQPMSILLNSSVNWSLTLSAKVHICNQILR